jgi:hypothetical protein
VYFNNDPAGAAVHDALAFARLAERAGRTVSRTSGRLGPLFRNREEIRNRTRP